jgi:hypothetical protein
MFRISCRSSGFVRSALQTDYDRRRRAEPPTRRRARDTEIGGDGQVPGALDEIPEPIVIALLRAGRGRHADDHRSLAHAAQLLKDDAGVRRSDDSSSNKVQNVRGDSSAAEQGGTFSRMASTRPSATNHTTAGLKLLSDPERRCNQKHDDLSSD